jgi:hypothetical protein
MKTVTHTVMAMEMHIMSTDIRMDTGMEILLK